MSAKPEELELLNEDERRNYLVGEVFATRLKFVSELWIRTFMRGMVWFSGGRRYRVHGVEHIQNVDPKEDKILLVSNHRSFFDFFVITYFGIVHGNMSARAFFPVRSTFFYERPLGLVVNMLMSGMSMFPPIMRDRKKLQFNKLALQRVVEELNKPGTYVGIHPEGTRGKGDDPYQFLPAHPGVGKVALEATGIRVIPIFILGMGSNLAAETVKNWMEPDKHPIDIAFGPDIDFDDLRPKKTRLRAQKQAADRCMEAIGALAEQVREYRGDPRPRGTEADSTKAASAD